MKKIFILFLFTVVLLGRSPHLLFATDFFSQPVSSSVWDMDENLVAGDGFAIGTGLSGDFSAGLSLTIAVENQANTPPVSYIWDLQECETAYATCTTLATWTT